MMSSPFSGRSKKILVSPPADFPWCLPLSQEGKEQKSLFYLSEKEDGSHATYFGEV